MPTLKIRYMLIIASYCAAIFWLSHQSDPPIPQKEAFSFPGADKLAHTILYAGLALVVSVGLYRSNETLTPRTQWFAPVIFAILYGLSDEIHQLYVPQREFEWLDLLADGTGATIAQYGLYIRWLRSGKDQ